MTAPLCKDCRRITWRAGGRCDDCARVFAEYVNEQNEEWHR